mmetsp:Transcript_4887/g.13465  ORF Transcript_4887/g.13465 Transcript_4887/m.13465 type:complete len:101 (+) Transcript_4887:706-1008(+)
MEYIWPYIKWYVYVESDNDGDFKMLPKYVAEVWDKVYSEGHLLSYRNHCMKRIATEYEAAQATSPAVEDQAEIELTNDLMESDNESPTVSDAEPSDAEEE